MVFKTTGSTSGITSFERFWKQCTVAGEISKTNKKIIQRIANISGYGALFSKPLKTRYSWGRAGRFEYHKPYELNKIGDNFLMDFSFFSHRFFLENLRKFFEQMGICWGSTESLALVFFNEIFILRGKKRASQIVLTRVRLLYILLFSLFSLKFFLENMFLPSSV